MIKNKNVVWVIRILLTIIGVLIIFFALSHYVKLRVKTDNYIETDAKFVRGFVIDRRVYVDSNDRIRESNRIKESITYNLIYEYLVNKEVYEIERTSSFYPNLAITKTVKYNPSNPEEALFIDLPVVQLFVGSLFLIMPVFSVSPFIFLGIFFAGMGAVIWHYYSSFGNLLNLADVISLSDGKVIVGLVFIVVGIGVFIGGVIGKIVNSKKIM